MRVSKLEPHVLGGEPLSTLDEFLEELSEDFSSAQPAQQTETAESSIDPGSAHEKEVAEGFVRLADYLRKKKVAGIRSQWL